MYKKKEEKIVPYMPFCVSTLSAFDLFLDYVIFIRSVLLFPTALLCTRIYFERQSNY